MIWDRVHRLPLSISMSDRATLEHFRSIFFYVFIVVEDDDDVVDVDRYSSVECKVNIILSDSDSSDLLTFRLGQRRVVLIRFNAVTPCFSIFTFSLVRTP